VRHCEYAWDASRRKPRRYAPHRFVVVAERGALARGEHNQRYLVTMQVPPKATGRYQIPPSVAVFKQQIPSVRW
jgi:hypothetical protein